jgi:hypothetical protein
MIHPKPFISINRVATLAGINHRTARRMLQSLELPTFLVGARWLYRTRDVVHKLAYLFTLDG